MELIHQSKDGCKTTVSTTDLFHALNACIFYAESSEYTEFGGEPKNELIARIAAFRNEVCSKIK